MAAKVYVSELPGCDFGADGERARFDFRTKSGAWANGCYQCWRQNRATYGLGVFSLGTGIGQLLLTPGETAGDIIVSMVRRACPSPGAARELLYHEFGELVFERKNGKRQIRLTYDESLAKTKDDGSQSPAIRD